MPYTPTSQQPLKKSPQRKKGASQQMRVLISHGEDGETVTQRLRKMTTARLGSKSHTAHIAHFYGGQSEMSAIMEATSTPPLFAPVSFILLHHYDRVREKKHLLALLENLHEKNVLYLIKETKPFHHSTFEQAVRRLPYVEIHIPYFANESKTQKQVETAFEAIGANLDRDALQMLTRMFMQEPMLLQMELNKCLTYFAGHKKTIHASDLNDILTVDAAYASTDVIEAAFRPQKNVFLRRWLVFLKTGGSLGELVVFLIRETEQLIDFHEERQRGTAEHDLFTRLRVFAKKQQQSLRIRAAQFSLNALERLLLNLYEVDQTLKSQSFSSGLLYLEPTVNQKARCQLERAILDLA